MANWWEYYKLKKAPLLSPDPLTRTEDQTLFFGRESDQQIPSTITQGQSTVAMLMTGNPGVGKTTLIHKLFMNNTGFIWVNLSNAQRFLDADVEIAESFISAVKKLNKSDAARTSSAYPAVGAVNPVAKKTWPPSCGSPSAPLERLGIELRTIRHAVF